MYFLASFSNLLNLLLRQGRDLPRIHLRKRIDVLGISGRRDGHSAGAHRPKQQYLRLSDALTVLSRDTGYDTRKNRLQDATLRGMAENRAQRAIGHRTDPVGGMNVENRLEVAQNERVVFEF